MDEEWKRRTESMKTVGRGRWFSSAIVHALRSIHVFLSLKSIHILIIYFLSYDHFKLISIYFSFSLRVYVNDEQSCTAFRSVLLLILFLSFHTSK